MNRPLRTIAVIGLLAATLPAACTAQQSPAVEPRTAAPTAVPAAPIVTGLPDFTGLVQQVGPAVVSVSAEVAPRRAARGQLPDQAEIPEFFRRFFGDDLPLPGGPGGPGQGGPRVPRGGGSSLGTGFLISADGYILTNHHVIEGADSVTVRLNDRRELPAKVVGSDAQSDVALLKVDGKGLPMLRTGDSGRLKPGQWVVAIGSPFGLDQSVTAGIVSAVGRSNPYADQRYVPFIQTDVAINRGNSGGPLLNTRGEVVGINSQIFSNSGGYMGVSFAIPIEVAMNAVRQLRDTGKVVRGQLGVRIQDVDRERLAELGLTRPVGAFIDSVENGSAAAKAGLRPGDVITRFNGREIGRSAELPPMVGAMPPGSRASVTVMRGGKPLDVVVILTSLDTAAAPAARAGPGAAPAPAAGNPLGVVVEELDASARDALGLRADEGVLVGRVVGLAARQAGLAPGDVILQVGRADIGSIADFDAAVKALKSGDEVRLLVRNARSTGFVTFTLR